jgi:hypothetical protein
MRMIHPLAAQSEGAIRVVLGCAHHDDGEAGDTEGALSASIERELQGDILYIPYGIRNFRSQRVREYFGIERSLDLSTLAANKGFHLAECSTSP